MAILKSKKNKKEIEIKNGSSIKNSAEMLGVPFGCETGTCGTCMIDIKKGKENLSELTQNEKDLDRDKKHRLACQCKIKKGEVVIDY